MQKLLQISVLALGFMALLGAQNVQAGVSLNGIALNGVALNGHSFHQIQSDDLTLKGLDAQSLARKN